MVETARNRMMMLRARKNERGQNAYASQGTGTALADKPYEAKRLSYANTFENPVQRQAIKTIEFATGKIRLLRMIRRFEAEGVPFGQEFWAKALLHMGISLETPAEQLARIPKDGPLVITCNHPHGLIDGIVLAELIGRVRTDYKILTRSLLTGVAEIEEFMIPVPFPHEPDALDKSLTMRARAMDQLRDGGVIALFPSGSVATSKTLLGSAIEAEWNPFTSKLIQRSGAQVLPVFFPGTNSRLYHMANQVSATLRQGLLLHEVVHSLNKPQAPVVGEAITHDELHKHGQSPREFMKWLRARTLNLENQRAC